MSSVTLSFSLDSEADKDVILFFDKVPKGEKSEVFRQVIRSHLGNAGVTLADLGGKVDRVLDLLTAGVALTTPAPPSGGSDGADVSKIDGLGM